MKKIKTAPVKIIVMLLLVSVITSTHAQQKKTTYDYSKINQAGWLLVQNDTLDYAVDNYLGAKAMVLKRKVLNYKSASVAYPKGLLFKDGIIEADIASPVGGNGFVGLAFRIADAHHYEVVYFRPGSSGTINAVQYMPEKKTDFNWWDYEADKYQAKAALPADSWFHVKLIVKGQQMAVYVNDMLHPVFTYNGLDASLAKGSVGFWLGNCGQGAYKNLTVKTW